MRKILELLFLGGILVLAFAGSVAAQTTDVPPDLGELIELAKPIAQAVMAGQYWLAAAAGLILAVGLVRRYLVPKYAFLQTDAGGTLLTFVAGFGGALVTALASGAGASLSLLPAAAAVAFAAIGGFLTVKRLVIPVFDWLADITPWAPLKWIFRYVPFLIDLLMGSKSSKKTIEKAEAAGRAAVEAGPSPGAGTPRDVL